MLAGKMADGLKVTIEPLDVDNYTVWSQKMRLLLTHKKLWKGVTDPAGDADRTEEARALMGLYVRSQLLGAILAAKNAKEAWEALEKTYKSKSAARKLQLRHELSTLKMRSGESVAVYVGRAQDLHRDLVAAGVEIKPDDLSFSVLAGLSSRFEGVVTVLTTTKEELGSVEELLPTLQVFEQRHGFSGEQDTKASGSATAAAYAAKGGNFAGKGKGGKANMSCHKCGKLGHFERECRSGSPKPQGPEKPKGRKECFVCGSPDHFKRDCPKRGQTGQGTAFVAGEGSETGQWVLDSGASQHMSGDKGLFQTLRCSSWGPGQLGLETRSSLR